MLCGLMIQVAMQLGLHRPSHSQDFSKFRVELIEEELRDKVRTWAICNIVAQRYVVSRSESNPSDCRKGLYWLWSATVHALRLDPVVQ